MKILIENYGDLYSTEPYYFFNTIKKIGGDAHIWDTSIYSAYDILDTLKPDVLVIKWNCRSKTDIIAYAKTNKSCPQIVVNVSEAPEETIQELKTIKQCKFFFTNEYHKENLTNNTWLIMPGVDLFLPVAHTVNYFLDAGICSDNPIIENFNYESYHKIYFGNEKPDNYDINTNLVGLTSIYNKYKDFVLIGKIKFLFSQIFFDANARSRHVTIKNEMSEIEDVRFILNKIFTFSEDEDIGKQIKQQIKNQHTCLNRTRQLLSLLENFDAASKIDNEIEKL